MIALLRSRWILLTVVVLVGIWLLSAIAGQIERRRGPSSLTRALRLPRERRRTSRAPSTA